MKIFLSYGHDSNAPLIDKIPNDINSYYYQLFSRVYQNNMTFYDEYVSKVLEVIVSSTKAMHLSLVKECAQIESERIFQKILGSLKQLIIIDNNEIRFFHKSLHNWLINPDVAGCYYVSQMDGKLKICREFIHWLENKDTTLDAMWLDYYFGFEISYVIAR